MMALLAAAALAQADSARPTLHAVRVSEGSITVDGRLGEEAWSRATPVSGFRQREPDQGEPATDGTDVRVVYDGGTLYVGVVAHVPSGATIVSRILQRDRLLAADFFGRPQFASDDAIAVLLDTFHDHRNAAIFATNPNGAEFDALLTDEGREFNVDWRAVWTVRAQRIEGGWSAEFAIPFRTLRYPDADGEQTWGFNVARVTRYNNQETLWTAWSRDNEGLHRVSRAGHLNGLEKLPRAGLALELKPHVLSSGDHDAGGTDIRLKGGLDAKYEVRPGLTLDATANTDFAQVEVDSEQVNLTRFDLFFPEKRDFFLENAGIFEFGARSVIEPPPFLLFFSRRIGISDSGAVPLIAGARLTGRAGRQTLGLLDVVTDSVIDQQRTNYSVLRLKRDLGASSYLGAMLTDLRRAGGYWNTAGGVDASFWPTGRLNLQGFYARTATAGGAGNGAAYRAAGNYESDHFGLTGYTLGVAPDATADLGFITRDDMRRYETFARLTPRPHALGLRKINLYYDLNVITHWDGGFQEWASGPAIGFEWQSGENVSLYGLNGRLKLDEAFDMSDSIPVDPGDYDNRILGWFANTAPQRAIAVSSTGGINWAYGGTVSTAQASLVVTPDPHVRVQAGGTRNWITLPRGSLVADLATLRLTLAFSTRVALFVLTQYNSLDRSVNANVRFNVIHRPGSDFFLVLNELRGSNTSLWDFDRRTAVVKLTYLARF